MLRPRGSYQWEHHTSSRPLLQPNKPAVGEFAAMDMAVAELLVDTSAAVGVLMDMRVLVDMRVL